MGFVEELYGGVVGLDTSPLIYFIERNSTFHQAVRPFFLAMAAGRLSAVTSTITLLETLVQPIRANELEIAQKYRDILLSTPGLVMYDMSAEVAAKAAELRANHRIRTPDAIQLATAIMGGATHFLTNDRSLKRLPELVVVLVQELS